MPIEVLELPAEKGPEPRTAQGPVPGPVQRGLGFRAQWRIPDRRFDQAVKAVIPLRGEFQNFAMRLQMLDEG